MLVHLCLCVCVLHASKNNRSCFGTEFTYILVLFTLRRHKDSKRIPADKGQGRHGLGLASVTCSVAASCPVEFLGLKASELPPPFPSSLPFPPTFLPNLPTLPPFLLSSCPFSPSIPLPPTPSNSLFNSAIERQPLLSLSWDFGICLNKLTMMTFPAAWVRGSGAGRLRGIGSGVMVKGHWEEGKGRRKCREREGE